MFPPSMKINFELRRAQVRSSNASMSTKTVSLASATLDAVA